MCRVREIGIKISLVITCTLRLNLTEIEIRDKKKANDWQIHQAHDNNYKRDKKEGLKFKLYEVTDTHTPNRNQ